MDYRVMRHEEELATGLLTECWAYLVYNFSKKTVHELVAQGIRIEAVPA